MINPLMAARFRTSPLTNVSCRGGLSVGVALAVSFVVFLSFISLCLGIEADESKMRESFFVLALEGAVISLSLVVKSHYSGMKLFEPFTMVVAVFTLTLFVAPVIEFGMGNVSRFGIDVSGNTLAATSTAIVGYIAFFLGYELFHPVLFRDSAFRRRNTRGSDSLVSQIALMLWIISYLLCLVNYLKRGYGLAYILTVGFGSEMAGDVSEDSLAFLAYAKYSLVGCWMCLFAFSKNKPILIITCALSASMLLFGGSRSSLLLILIAPLAFHFICLGREPRVRSVLLTVVVLVFVFAAIQVARNGVKLGNGFSLDGYSLSEMFSPYLNEVEGYKIYYALFNVFPEKMDHLFGSQMFGYTFVMLIPRAIWPGKPDAAIHEIVYQAMGLQALQSGNSYPFIGELFVEFGIVGCFVGMLLFGIICKKLGQLRLCANTNKFRLIIYCLFFPALFQIMIRGYFPSNCMMLLFLLVPVLLVDRFSSVRKEKVSFPVFGEEAYR